MWRYVHTYNEHYTLAIVLPLASFINNHTEGTMYTQMMSDTNKLFHIYSKTGLRRSILICLLS